MINATHLKRAGHLIRKRQTVPTTMAINQPSFDSVQKNPATPRKSARAMTAVRITGRNRLVLSKANTMATGNSIRTKPAKAFG